MKTKSRIREKAKKIALECFIYPKDEFLDRLEEELEKAITPEFIEKVRSEMLRKPKTSKESKDLN